MATNPNFFRNFTYRDWLLNFLVLTVFYIVSAVVSVLIDNKEPLATLFTWQKIVPGTISTLIFSWILTIWGGFMFRPKKDN